jgi:L-lysine exporter family protein LysE/ArgO
MSFAIQWQSFPSGFFASAALVAAIGAQNAYVLRLGLRRLHVAPVVLLCIVSDALLIAAGVLGMGSLLASWPALLVVARWGGVAFLAAYGVFALRRAVRADGAGLAAASARGTSLARTLVTVLGLTFLNPHVYLDTVVLLGALGSAEPAAGRVPFVLGAVLASATWFVALGFGARRLSPLFARPHAWRVLDAGVGALMLALAVGVARFG